MALQEIVWQYMVICLFNPQISTQSSQQKSCYATNTLEKVSNNQIICTQKIRYPGPG